MNKRVQSLLKNNGVDFFSRIGKKGYQVTCDRYFGGDKKAMNKWLTDMGNYSIYAGLSYHKPAIEHYPGDHPAKVQKQAAWLAYVESAISSDFPPFGNDVTDIT